MQRWRDPSFRAGDFLPEAIEVSGGTFREHARLNKGG
jgi:inner membrane protein involved in colicin E2 resistance